MAIKLNLSQTQQEDVVKYVADTFSTYKDRLSNYHGRCFEVYKEYSTFTQQKEADWKTTFKVNKAHEVVNKILPRIMSKNPKWIVSSKPDTILDGPEGESDDDKKARLETLQMQSSAVKDYLSTVFDKYNLTEPARLWAKNMVVYGNAFAKIKFKYELGRTEVPSNKERVYIDENGEEQVEKIEKEIKEFVYNQYPTIDATSWTDLYYDPRYKVFGDAPAIIEVVNGVRLSELKATKGKYINLDKIEALPELADFTKDVSSYKERVQAIAGINAISMTKGVDKNALTLKKYYGLYELEDEERLYEFCVVEDLIVISAKEISFMPFELIRCFEDTETMLSWGFVEPMMWLQKVMNFKKNSESEYMNHALNRSYFYNPNSGINPRDLISKPGAIIPTTKSMQEVDNYFREIPYRDVNSWYFSEQNDMERQIQAVTFTIDTSNPRNQNSLTNTATGARIKMFESNTVIEEIRKHFEKWLENLAYKLLQETAENIEENLVIKKIGDEGFWEMNKEAIVDAIKKYEIRVEIGSSSMDSIEDRRDDTIAKFNMGLQAMQAGIPVDMEALRTDTVQTFENNDSKNYLKAPQMQEMMGQPMGTPSPLEWPQAQPTDAAAITEQVAQGNMTAGA